MTLAPLLAASPAIQLHVAAVCIVVVLTGWQLLLAKGTPLHRACGYAWVLAMAVTALSSFFIRSVIPGSFSLIHILSVVSLASLVGAVHAARTGQIARHRRIILALVWGAVVGAGAFTVLPGRIMHAVLTGG